MTLEELGYALLEWGKKFKHGDFVNEAERLEMFHLGMELKYGSIYPLVLAHTANRVLGVFERISERTRPHHAASYRQNRENKRELKLIIAALEAFILVRGFEQKESDHDKSEIR